MDKFVVRQAVKDGETDQIIGYEIIFQNDNDSLYNSSDSQAAHTISTFLMQNSDVFKDELTFLTFPPSLFFRNTPKMFDNEKMIIQVEDSIIVHPLALTIIQKYRSAGYKIAINDFQFSPKYFTLLEHVDYVKIVISGKRDERSFASLDNMMRMMQGFHKKCIAVGVETKEDYELAKKIGADYFQGGYIEESQITKVNKMEYMESNFLQLVVAVGKTEPDIEEIGEIISRDATLTYSILKIVNSAYFAMRSRVSSIQHALVILGISQLRQWVYLLSFNRDDNNSGMKEVLRLSFQRAIFCDALVDRMKGFPISSSEAYMMGMFSTIDYLIDGTLEEILQGIPIQEEVREALINQTGAVGTLYKLMISYEKANWKEIKVLSKELDLPSNIMAQTYMDAVEEANEIWKQLESAQEFDKDK